MPKLIDGFKFDEIAARLLEASNGVASSKVEVGVAHNTVAYFKLLERNGPAFIGIRFHETEVVRIYDDGSVLLNNGGYKTETTRRRMDAALRPLGKRLVTVRRIWKVYDIESGEYRDYFNHMIVKKEG